MVIYKGFEEIEWKGCKKMNVKVEKTDKPNEVKLEFTIEANLFEEGIKKAFVKNAKYFSIPGFRKGKAPYNLVEKYYGKEIFYEDAFNEVVPSIYDEAVKEHKLDVVSRPEIDIKKMEKGQDLEFIATVQVCPEVKLGKYKEIELKKVEYKVSEEDINKEVEQMASKNARMISVEDRPVKKDDIVLIDFEGFVDGKPFDGGKAEDYELIIGSHSFIEGFEEQIIGMNIEDEKDINVKFPDDYFAKDLSGKEATFKVVLHEIKKKEMPEIDDDLAKDISEFDTLAELKNDIKEQMQKENEDRSKYEMEEEAIKIVADNVDIDIPSGMIETETHNIIHNMEHNLAYQGIKLDQYLNMIGKTRKELEKEYEEDSRKTVKQRLVLNEIAKVEKIEPTEKEIEDRMKEMATQYGRKEEDINNNTELKDYVTSTLKVEKTIQFLVDNAKIVEDKKSEKKSESKKTASKESKDATDKKETASKKEATSKKVEDKDEDKEASNNKEETKKNTKKQ